MTPPDLALELTMLVAFWLCLAVWQKDASTPGRLNFVLLALAGAVWCYGDLALHRGVIDEVVADRIRYAGILSTGALWLGIACHAARLDIAQRVPWFPAILLTPNAFVYALLFSDTWGGLFLVTVPDAPDIRGPFWWVAAFYSWGLVATGSAVVIVSGLRDRPLNATRIALGFTTCLPLAANTWYVTTNHQGFDPTPALVGVALLALRQATFSGGLLQMLPVSQLDLLQQLPQGLILTDRYGTILSLNPAAARRLGTTSPEAVGRALDAVLQAAPDPPEVETAPLRSLDEPAGVIVMLDPPGRKRPPPAPGI